MDFVLLLWVLCVTLTPPLTMAPAYSRQVLLGLREQCQNKKIGLPTYLLLRKLGISAKQPTHRGIKAHTQSAVPTCSDLTELCLLNCQSVCNKAEVIVDYITEKKVDIFGLTETWLCEGEKHSSVIADLTPQGYDFVHIPRPTHGGGVAIIHRQSYKRSPLIPFKAESFESVACELRHHNSVINLAVIYRPPNPAKSTFLDEFTEFVTAFSLSGKNAVIIGDFNFHMDKQDDRDVCRLNDVLSTTGLVQHVSDVTHTCGHILDLVISNSSEDTMSRVEVGSFITDHAVVHSTLRLTKPSLPVEVHEYRKFKSIDHEAFSQDLSNSPLIQSPASSLIGLVTQYNEVLTGIIDKHAPLKRTTVRPKPYNVWHNDQIIEAKKECRRHERRWRRTKAASDRIAFVEKREAFKCILRSSKSKYFSERISECGDQRSLFRVTEELLHLKGKPKLPSHTDKAQLADRFNSFFSDKIKAIRETLDGADSVSVSTHTDSPRGIPVMDSFSSLTEEDIVLMIKKAPTKSCALDPIPTWLLKQHISTLAPVITKMVNMSLEQGVVPSDMKRALVTPLIKKPSLDCEQYKNYRPVSNLTFISKLVERAVDAQLACHMAQHSLYEPMQSAYRKFHGTETALVKVQNDLLMALDRRQGAFLVLLDLSSAFDTIDHQLLLERLRNNIGVEGTVLKWMESYLSDRYQSVSIGGVCSSHHQLEYGVPQGSVLGPKLFTVYAAPIAKICNDLSLPAHMYADDSQLYLWFDLPPNGNEDMARQLITLCVDNILKWCMSNKLKMNEEKTELLVVSAPQQKHKISSTNLVIGSTVVTAVDSVRDLGARLDQHLHMDAHVSAVCQAAYYQVRNISRIRGVLTQESAKTLVNALVLSRLDNSNALLANISKELLLKLQRVQNAAVRCVIGLRKRDSVRDALSSLHWLPVKYRIQFKLLLLTWKSLNGEAPTYLRDLLKPKQFTRQLRSSSDSLLEVPRTNLKTYGDRAFSVQAPKLWNALPSFIRLQTTRDSFKRALKTHLFRSAFERLH